MISEQIVRGLKMDDKEVLEIIERAARDGREHLDLSGKGIEELPSQLGKLHRLEVLWLHGNKLRALPAEIGQLRNLNYLYLDQNQLDSIPPEIGMLEKLKMLWLSNNRLSSLPAEIGKLNQLETLWLNYNPLASLPSTIGQLTNLEDLRVEGAELVSPPPEVVARGVDAIRSYFRQLGKEGKDHIYEAKLLIVGEAGAGKTSLSNKIKYPDYILRDSELSTEGIEVIEWHFYMADGQDFRVNIWDFGGQEIYHATHQFFLTKRSLYGLVADTRKEDTDFNYWLNVVELLSDDSPLLMIMNEKQDRHKEINERVLRERFSNIKGTLVTNLASNRGLAEIRKEIKHHISRLPHIGAELPKTWVKVREELEKDARNYISLEEYLQICERNGFQLLEDKLQLSGYLHDLGVCLHFREDALLRKTVILKPEWGDECCV